MKSLLFRSSLFQFIIIGLVIFWLHALVKPHLKDKQTIILKDNYINVLSEDLENETLKPVTDHQRIALKEEAVLNEVLYREALNRDLDNGDEIIRRHLIQKMNFLVESMSKPDHPSEKQLKSWFNLNRNQYLQEKKYSFQHVYFNARSKKIDAFKQLVKQNQLKVDSATKYGEPFLRGQYFKEITKTEVLRSFGENFFNTINSDHIEKWLGPTESIYGIHFVYVEKIFPARELTFEEVKADIYKDYMKEKLEEKKQEIYQKLIAQYEIVID